MQSGDDGPCRPHPKPRADPWQYTDWRVRRPYRARRLSGRTPHRPADRRDAPVRRRNLALGPFRRRARRGEAAAAAAPAMEAPSARPLDRGRQHRVRGLAGREDRPVRVVDRRRRDGGRLRACRGCALYRAAYRLAARGTAITAISYRLRARAVQPAIRAAVAAAIRHRCARMQGKRRGGHGGETDRGARGRNSGYHGPAPAA